MYCISSIRRKSNGKPYEGLFDVQCFEMQKPLYKPGVFDGAMGTYFMCHSLPSLFITATESLYVLSQNSNRDTIKTFFFSCTLTRLQHNFDVFP